MSNPQNFINSIKDDALKYQTKFGVPASIIIAQACLETGYGKSVCKDINSGLDSKNLFNIKGEGSNGHVTVWTTEFYSGVRTKVQANFRAYKTYEDSFADHARLLLTNRYKPCMAVKNDSIKFAQKLYDCGYATDPKYASKLIWIMNQYGLLNLKPVVPIIVKPPVLVVPKKEEIKVNITDANNIIKILSAMYDIVKTQEDKDEVHRLANELRKASGQAMEN